MTIDPKEKIAGCSILRIRNFIRTYFDHAFDLTALTSSLELDVPNATAVVEWMKANKYIQLDTSSPEPRWHVTDHAGAFANASAGKKISRATADRLLGQLVARAEEANA